MELTTTCPPPEMPLLNSPPLRVVIAYEDYATGQCARRTCRNLAEQLQPGAPCLCQMWKFELLAVRKLRDLAAEDAAAADIIVVSAHGRNELPPEVKSWVEMWIPGKGRVAALVALSNHPDSWGATPVRDYLAEVARRGNLTFIPESGGSLAAETNDEGWPDGPRRATRRAFALLAGLLGRESEWPRREFNE